MTDARRDALEFASEEVEKLMTRVDSFKGNSWYNASGGCAGIPERVIRAFDALAQTERLDRFASHLLASRKRYGLHDVLIPAVKAIQLWIKNESPASTAYQRLRGQCLTELRSLTANPIEPPQDWVRAADLGCACADCQALAKFLRNPNQKEARFPLRQDRRQHLHQQIDDRKIDLTHVTDRRGRPQTLVCTKTQASYERRRGQYEVDCRLLQELEGPGAPQPRRAAAPARGEKKPNPKAKPARR